MTTIEIIQELGEREEPHYRAIHRERAALGDTPGQALDSLERVLAGSQSEAERGLLVIVQRFRPDAFFTAEQQARLRVLMDRFHEAQAKGEGLPPDEQAELEQLVDAEWDAALARGQTILDESASR